MILFSFSSYEHIARELHTIPLLRVGQFAIARYDNQELHAEVQCRVSGEHCLVLGSIAPPDEQMLSLMLLAHTLKKGGSRKGNGCPSVSCLQPAGQGKARRELGNGLDWLASEGFGVR